MALRELVGAFGFDLALNQHPNAQRRHFDTVWTFNVLFGLVTAAVLALLGGPAPRRYDEPRLVPVIFGVAAARAISSVDVRVTASLRWFAARLRPVPTKGRRSATRGRRVRGATPVAKNLELPG